MREAKSLAQQLPFTLETALIDPLHERWFNDARIRDPWTPKQAALMEDEEWAPDVVLGAAVGKTPPSPTTAFSALAPHYDLITMIESWQYMPDCIEAVRWALERLRPGGLLVIRMGQPLQGRFAAAVPDSTSYDGALRQPYLLSQESDRIRRSFFQQLTTQASTSAFSFTIVDAGRGVSHTTGLDVQRGRDAPTFTGLRYRESVPWDAFRVIYGDGQARPHTTSLYDIAPPL